MAFLVCSLTFPPIQKRSSAVFRDLLGAVFSRIVLAAARLYLPGHESILAVSKAHHLTNQPAARHRPGGPPERKSPERDWYTPGQLERLRSSFTSRLLLLLLHSLLPPKKRNKFLALYLLDFFQSKTPSFCLSFLTALDKFDRES